MIFDELGSLDDIRGQSVIIDSIRWDLQPKDLMEPRTKMTAEGIKAAREPIKGYVFYIDTMGAEPILYLMRHTAMDFAETAAQIKEIPAELLLEAIEENKDKAYFKMYPINKKVEDWLRRELGAL